VGLSLSGKGFADHCWHTAVPFRKLCDSRNAQLSADQRQAGLANNNFTLMLVIGFVASESTNASGTVESKFKDECNMRKNNTHIVSESQATEAFAANKPEKGCILGMSGHSRWLSFRARVLGASLLTIFVLPGMASTVKLKPETLKAWQAYVEAARVRMQGRLKGDGPFLLSDDDPARAAKLRTGEILVAPVGPHIPQSVPSGLIHDWSGEVFIPNVTVPDVLRVIRNYEDYKQIYTPAVIDSEAIEVRESEDQFSMVLMNRSLIAKTALDGQFQSDFFRVSEQRWYSVSETTRIQEISGYGTDNQHRLPQNEGMGLIWRTYAITRFEERDGGVYIETEAIVLSRDIPISLRWMVNPIVRRISRSSLTTSLSQTRDAVMSGTKFAKAPSVSEGCQTCAGVKLASSLR
jgi:hypothetical protein